MADLVRTPLSRVFTIEDRAGPAHAPVYQSLGRAMSPSWDFGDTTPIRIPDPGAYGRFLIVDRIRGEKGQPEMSIQARYRFALSAFLELARKGCPIDAQVHMGKCQNPADFNGGWDKVLVLEGGDITNWSTDELGALDQGEDAVVNEEVPLTGLDLYEVKQLLLGQVGETEVVQEVVDVAICDTVTCGVCGIPSDGCQKVLALTMSAGGSPGLAAELIASSDGGGTLKQMNVSSLAANEDPDEMHCVGANLVIVSIESCSLHYAPLADIFAAGVTPTWTEVATGLVCAAGAPAAIDSVSPLHTWIVGNGGHIYFTADPTGGVTVQNAGVATVENLRSVHAYDDLNVVAVGVNNAVVVTSNGGSSWASVTGPAVGVALNVVRMRSPLEWFVGTAGGQLWYTRDGGASWTQKAFPGSGTGVVRDLVFATPTVGYLAHSTALVAGRILRTIDGGFSWYVLPEGSTNIPANDYIGALAACAEDANLVWGGGLDDNAADGILVRGA